MDTEESVVPQLRQHRVGDARPSLRRALVGDARAVAAFQTVCWRGTYAGLVPQAYLDRVGVPERELRWRERIGTGARAVVLAEDHEHIVGVVSWRLSPLAGVPALELASLYVGSTHQGAGLGGQLLCHAVHDDPAHLWVFEDNLRARAFYQRHGFVAEGRQTRDADTGLTELLYVRR